MKNCVFHSNKDIISWYEGKTQSIIEKYGSGYKIHFHTGYFDKCENPSNDLSTLKKQLINSQEKLLIKAFEFSNWESRVGSTVIDVGCGLGGTSIYLAQKFNVNVIALTNIPTHIKLIERHVEDAGVSDRVEVVLGDACEDIGKRGIDSAVAIESSCYFERLKWFKTLKKILKKGGHVLISDCYTTNVKVVNLFEEYWLTRLGSLDEYFKAAEKTGLILDMFKDITLQTLDFWRFSALYSSMKIKKVKKDTEIERLRKSIKWHKKLYDIWSSRKLQYGFLIFRLK
jgi:tocopherol O-methyltransferase